MQKQGNIVIGSSATGGVTKRLSQEYSRMANEIAIADGSYYKLPGEYKNACANVHNSYKSEKSISEKRAIEQNIEQLYAKLTNPKQKQNLDFAGENKTGLFLSFTKNGRGKESVLLAKSSTVLCRRIVKSDGGITVMKIETIYGSARGEGMLPDVVISSPL
ncbi:MAG: hypothetical protein PHR68_04680 [Candidatus Gracilibacteria bacterium]|nr:hypothetical protein [Candidatus Gracilibacteria bacterium]